MATKAERRRLKEVLKLQFPFPFDIDRFLDRAIREFPEDPATFAFALILKSKAFKKRFPGIFKGDGTLRISPAEYIQREERYASVAAEHGFNLKRGDVGALVSRDVDPEEFGVRARGIQLARQNPGLVDFLNKQIKQVNRRRRAAAGPDGDFVRIPLIKDRRDIVDFFTGRADKTLYKVYEGALFQQAADEAGLDLSGKRGRKLANATAGVLDPEAIQQGFAEIAAKLRLGDIDLKVAGISQRDLEVLEFGGPGQAAIAEKARGILAGVQNVLQGPESRRAVGRTQEARPVVLEEREGSL